MIKELTKEKHLKYILSDLQDYANGKFASPLELVDSECELLLNYITNLQKDNKHLDKVNCKLRKKINNDVYKSRNEKAIEYIEERKKLNWYADGVFVYELLNILQVGDE